MEIVNVTKFAIGCALFVAGIAVLVAGRGGRGFNQRRQAGVLMLLASAFFVSIGLGLLNL